MMPLELKELVSRYGRGVNIDLLGFLFDAFRNKIIFIRFSRSQDL